MILAGQKLNLTVQLVILLLTVQNLTSLVIYKIKFRTSRNLNEIIFRIFKSNDLLNFFF